MQLVSPRARVSSACPYNTEQGRRNATRQSDARIAKSNQIVWRGICSATVVGCPVDISTRVEGTPSATRHPMRKDKVLPLMHVLQIGHTQLLSSTRHAIIYPLDKPRHLGNHQILVPSCWVLWLQSSSSDGVVAGAAALEICAVGCG